jgi:diguanylate cyclase (GGDEF)-like protein
LTGLPNRRFFVEKLDEYLRSTSDTRRLAVLMLDLDGFKKVNDMHGHATGDKALTEFAHRVAALLRADSVLARIGGDEFAIIMPKINSLDDPTNPARRIAAAVAQPFVIDNSAAEFGVGVGIAIAPNDGTDLDELVRRADRALYRAKGAGRSSVRFFEPEMDTHVERRIQIERELRSAIASNAVVPHYQPLVSLDGNRIIGFEALARWKSESLGFIVPDVFIPIAEEPGLINALGDQLFRRACIDASTWPADFILAFNISPILSILGQTGFSPRRLEIEITESALVENITVVQSMIDSLRSVGVRIALDDFGTGYATLTQLLSFHLDKVKIDRSFVSHLDKSGNNLVIVRAILGLAEGLGLTTTAEGIEDAAELLCPRPMDARRGKATCSARPCRRPKSPLCSVVRSSTLPRPELESRSEAGDFPPHDGGAFDHGAHLAVGDRAPQVFEAAARRDDDARGRHVRQRAADARGDGFRRLDRHIRQVERAEDDGLAGKLFQHRAVETGLSGLDRHLLHGRAGEFRQE